MTIISGFFQDDSPWSSMWDWTRSRGLFGQYNRLDEVDHLPPQTARNRGFSSPLEYFSRPGYTPLVDSCYWSDEFSDNSDCEMFDVNTNSRPRSHRTLRLTTNGRNNGGSRNSAATSSAGAITSRRSNAASRLSGASHNFTRPEVIKIDDDDQEQSGTRRKIVKYDLTESKSKSASDSLSENINNGRVTRSSSRSADPSTKDDVHIIDYTERDFDTESIINETCSYTVYAYLKTFLKSTGRQIDAMRGDGNCFFRALSKDIYGSQKFYDDIRQAVVEVLSRHPKKFEAFTDLPMPDHITEMHKDKTWATQTEIYAAATLLNRDIYILSPDQSGETYRWLLFKPLLKYNNESDSSACRCYVTICHTHGNHYDRVIAIGSKCNCGLPPPEMSGVKASVDLTSDDEIV